MPTVPGGVTPASKQGGRKARRQRAPDGTGTPQQQHDRANEQIAQLERILQQHQRENQRLRVRLAWVESGLELLDSEAAETQHQMLVKLGKRIPLLPAGSPLTGAEQHGALSVCALPEPGSWTFDMEQRVSRLSVLDMVLLHRQFMQEMAMLLPKAQLFGSSSKEHKALWSLQSRYVNFNQKAIMLAPQSWSQRSRYSMETLEPYEPPSPQFFRDIVKARPSNERIRAHFQLYAATAGKLKAEYQELSALYQRLVQSLPGNWRPAKAGQASRPPGGAGAQAWAAVPPGRGTSGSAYGPDGSPLGQQPSLEALGARQPVQPISNNARMGHGTGHSMGLHEVVERMQRNLWRQRMAVKQCLYATWKGMSDPVDVAQGYLQMYPLPLDAVDFLDALMNAGVRAAADSAAPAVHDGCPVKDLPE